MTAPSETGLVTWPRRNWAVAFGALMFFSFGCAVAAPLFHGDASECRRLLDDKKYQDALRVCENGSRDGKPASQFNLSVIYLNGYGVNRDEAKAIKWLMESASKRYPPAEYALASRYLSGSGVEKNTSKSLELLTDAANQGFVLAQLMLGKMNEAGYEKLGIKQDTAAARSWYQSAGEQCAACNYELWRIYFFGIGVDKDFTRAAQYLTTSAMAGLPKAQMQLGFRFYKGEGVPQNYIQAYKWFYIAETSGEETSKKARTLLAKKMPFSQVAEAKKQAKALMQGMHINKAQICSMYNRFCDQ